jgi:hypothetical protein
MSPKAFSLDIEDSSDAEHADDVAQIATQPELTSIAPCSDVSESGSFGLNPEWRPVSDVAGGMMTGAQFEELDKAIAREPSRKYINVPGNEGTFWCRSKANRCHVLEIYAGRGGSLALIPVFVLHGWIDSGWGSEVDALARS